MKIEENQKEKDNNINNEGIKKEINIPDLKKDDKRELLYNSFEKLQL